MEPTKGPIIKLYFTLCYIYIRILLISLVYILLRVCKRIYLLRLIFLVLGCIIITVCNSCTALLYFL